jgi:hypothetical protein
LSAYPNRVDLFCLSFFYTSFVQIRLVVFLTLMAIFELFTTVTTRCIYITIGIRTSGSTRYVIRAVEVIDSLPFSYLTMISGTIRVFTTDLTAPPGGPPEGDNVQ